MNIYLQSILRLATSRLLGLCALFACALLPLYGAGLNDLTYSTTDGEVTITDCNTAATGTLIIPEYIGGSPVTSIGKWAFASCTSLTSIKIPNRVSIIERYAFGATSSLTTIEVGADNSTYAGINGVLFNKEKTHLYKYPQGRLGGYIVPKSVIDIGEESFSDCDNLTSITISNGVTRIGNYAFESCTSLTNITFPNSITSIGKNTFRDCTSLTSITIPDGVPRIGNYAFESCTSLTNVTIPDSVTSIGTGAFGYCNRLTSITISNKLVDVGERIFQNCTSLTSITIPNSVTSIGRYPFLNCTSLSSITIPDSVTSIGTFAFQRCTNLESITIGNGITSIGDGAFSYCTSLTNISIGNAVTNIGDNAFRSCTSLTNITIPDSVTSIGDRSFFRCTNLTSITIPNSVTSIGVGTFESCTSLLNISIPHSVTRIGEGAFSYCTSLTSIKFQGLAPNVGFGAFFGVAGGAKAFARPEHIESYGGEGVSWPTRSKGLTVQKISPPVINLKRYYESLPGETVLIDAAAIDGITEKYDYQWCFNGLPISDLLGGSAAVQVINGIEEFEGKWKVVVTNCFGETEHRFDYRILVDTDEDGLSDGYEELVAGTNPELSDADGDGLNDYEELMLFKTNPNQMDTDEDGYDDGEEILKGTDPNDSRIFPERTPIELRIEKLNVPGLVIFAYWTGQVGKTYSIEYSADFQDWNILDSGIKGTGLETSRALPGPKGYVRIAER